MSRAGLFMSLLAVLSFGLWPVVSAGFTAGPTGIGWCAECGADRGPGHDFTHGRGMNRFQDIPQRVFVAPPRQFPNVVRLPNGKYRPKSGYLWVSKDPRDMRVRRVPPGTRHERYPHVVYASGGRLQPAWGYRWVSPKNRNDFRVELKPAGTPHHYYANVEWDGRGELRPASGYTWASRTPGDYRVVRIVVVLPRPPPDLAKRYQEKRAREQRLRRTFESGMDYYMRRQFERARDAFKELRQLDPDNEHYRQYLRKSELGVASRQRKAMAEAYRRRVGPGFPDGIYVPSPRIVERYYVQIPPAKGTWHKYADPLVDVGNTALRRLQDGARWAADEAWNQARLKMESKLKSLPSYDLYVSFKQLKEKLELLQKGCGDRVIEMQKRNMRAVREAIVLGDVRGDLLAAGEEDRKAFARLAGEAAQPGAQGRWVPSGKSRPQTDKGGATLIKRIRHAVGFRFIQWLGE